MRPLPRAHLRGALNVRPLNLPCFPCDSACQSGRTGVFVSMCTFANQQQVLAMNAMPFGQSRSKHSVCRLVWPQHVYTNPQSAEVAAVVYGTLGQDHDMCKWNGKGCQVVKQQSVWRYMQVSVNVSCAVVECTACGQRGQAEAV